MLPYPAWLTARDRQRINTALECALGARVLPPHDGGPVAFFTFQFPSQASAVAAVLLVARVIVEVVPARARTAADAGDPRAAVDQLLDALIVDMQTGEPDAFDAAVRAALDAAPWWISDVDRRIVGGATLTLDAATLTSDADLAVQGTAALTLDAATLNSSAFTRLTFASELRALKDETGLSVEDLAAMADVNEKTIDRYLSSEHRPARDKVKKLERQLGEYLKRPVKFSV